MSIIAIHDLVVEFTTPSGQVRALDGATFEADPGEHIAIVGESGSGKSTLANTIGSLLPKSANYENGTIEVDGIDVLSASNTTLRALRRDTLGFIPQDPIATLDPTKRIQKQLALVVGDLGGDTSKSALAERLAQVQINDPELVLRRYPHQLSGGMAQRVAIAIAMARKPRILIADEPTAALDANVRREVLRLMFDFAESAGTTVIWLSHDLDAVSRWCERTLVMYRGQVVEDGPTSSVLHNPEHAYAQSLLDAMPSRLSRDRTIQTYTESIRAGEPEPAVREETS